jgi:acyl-CoA synthetase (AMP-forming)/AMP-acid ligase II
MAPIYGLDLRRFPELNVAHPASGRTKTTGRLANRGNPEDEAIMLGLMQNRPLLISNMVDYVATWHAETEIVSRDPKGGMHRSSYGVVALRAKRLANAFAALGIGSGERVATLAWNSWRHLEVYYGVTCSGRVLHTVNPRLFIEQLVYVINHAENGYVFFDPDFTPLVEQLAPHLPLVRGWIALCDEKDMPPTKLQGLKSYETLLANASPD